MKKLYHLSVCLLLSSVAFAQTSGTGIGIIAGEPTGFSFKHWTGAKNAFDGGIAWSLDGDGALHLHADYLFHSFGVFSDEERIALYYGGGGRIRFGEGDNDDVIGVRIPVGLLYAFTGAPIDLFLELVPMVDVAPDTDFGLAGAIGARYFF
jgi:hypothetical protein